MRKNRPHFFRPIFSIPLVLWIVAGPFGCRGADRKAPVAPEKSAKRIAPAGPSFRNRPVVLEDGGSAGLSRETPRGPCLWSGRDEAEILRIITSQPITGARPTSGRSLSYKLYLEGGLNAAWKPATSRAFLWRAEVAAYLVSKALGMCSVPPSAPRTVDVAAILRLLGPEHAANAEALRKEARIEGAGLVQGAVMYWVPDLSPPGLDGRDGVEKWTSWLRQSTPLEAVDSPRARQTAMLVLFDTLIANWDRWTGGNLFEDPTGRMVAIDHHLAFGVKLKKERQERIDDALGRVERFPQGFVTSLWGLTREGVAGAVNGKELPGVFLSEDEIEALLKRRDAIRTHVDRLVAQYGESRVFAWP